jgi:hypothetical protein
MTATGQLRNARHFEMRWHSLVRRAVSISRARSELSLTRCETRDSLRITGLDLLTVDASNAQILIA